MGTIILYSILLIVLTPPLGAYMHRVYTRAGRGRVEAVAYRLLGVNPDAEQSWRRYAASVLWFSAVSMLFVYLLLRLQQHLPLNPQGLPAVNPYVSFNTAASFVTNTNWQAYSGETTMSYLSQMLALSLR
jgi:K+-transporting ATPase ATPase A chain